MEDIKILLLEDEEIVRNALSRMLSKRVGYVYTAKNGREGLKTLQEVLPDIIITDLEMPLLDGKEFIKQARESFPEIPVIVITAFKEHRKELPFVSHFLVKPHSRQDIVSAIENCCDHVLKKRSESSA